jgi:CheY-like chemotaxis protein
MLGAGGGGGAPFFGGGIERVLLVEDNDISREIMKNQLTSMGFTVHAAANGRQGLADFRAADYDLVLTDLDMPELGGLGLVQAIRRLETAGGRRTPVLAITAADFELTAAAAAACGFDGHMLKPLDAELLRVRLQSFIGR